VRREREAILRSRRQLKLSERPLKLDVRRLDVPRYEVTVQGQGIVVPVDTSLAVGFFRLVNVIARDPVEAEKRAVERVKSEWESGTYAFTNRGGPPYLTISNIGVLSWWHRLLGAPKGYIFFAEDGVQMPSNQRLERP
jgi:hypothetical protein